jgi:uncharacterized protein YeaO (DUF488 family)
LSNKIFPIQVKRIYESPSPDDGYRILVDRLWPRGIKKVHANIDLWLKEIAPSDSLRKWFNHEPEKWEDFQRRYSEELDQKQDLVEQLTEHVRKGKVIFIFSAKNEIHNNAVALREYLRDRI